MLNIYISKDSDDFIEPLILHYTQALAHRPLKKPNMLAKSSAISKHTRAAYLKSNPTNPPSPSHHPPTLIEPPPRELRRALHLGGRDRSIGARCSRGHGLEGRGRPGGGAEGELLAVGAADHAAGGGAGAARGARS